jgi:hypothetical protein
LDGITTRVGKTEAHLIGMYATSTTAGGTAAKVATIVPALPSDTNWELTTGTTVTVKFTTANTAASPTLNVNSKGAKPIKTYSGGNLSADEYKWKAGATFTFTYNGTNWLMQDSTNAVRLTSAETVIEQTANNVLIKATKNDTTDAAAGKKLIESFINVNPETVKISAKNVEIDGATTFNAIKESADAAYDSKGSASAVQTNLDNLEVGGRNLLRSGALTQSTGASFVNNGTSYSLNFNQTYSALVIPTSITAEAGDITISYKFKKTDGTLVNIGIPWSATSSATCKSVYYDGVSKTLLSNFNFSIADDTNEHTVSYTLSLSKAATVYIQLNRAVTTAVTAEIWDIKVEKGNKATDWTPAPEDVQAEIDGIEIGGRNLIKATSLESNEKWTTNTCSAVLSDNKVTIENAGEFQLGVLTTPYCGVIKAGTKLTLSCYIYENTIKANRRIYYAKTPSWRARNIPEGFTGLWVDTFEAPDDITVLVIDYDMRNRTEGKIVCGPCKLEIGTRATDWTPAPEDIEAAAVAEEQYIYISKASGTTSVSGTTTWITENGDKQNTWTTKRPTYNTSYPVLFVAKQKKVVSGTVTCTTPVKDDTTTIIDGGHITTGTIDASKATITNINGANIKAGTLSIGKIDTDDQDKILNSKIEIGGRNLLLASEKTVTKDLSTSSDLVWFAELTDYGKDNLPVGTNIVISFDAKASVAGLRIGGRYVRNSSATPVTTTPAENNDITLTTSWVRYSAMCSISATGAHQLSFYSGMNTAASGVISIRNAKVEIGNKATDWASAPEDTVPDNFFIDAKAERTLNITGTDVNSSWYMESDAGRMITANNVDDIFLLSYDWSSTGITDGQFYPQIQSTSTWVVSNIISAIGTTVSNGCVVKPTASNNSGHVEILFRFHTTQVGHANGQNLRFRAYNGITQGGSIKLSNVKLSLAPNGETVGDARKTATSYITNIGNDGIRVHDSHTTNNSVVINSNGMEVFKGGTTSAYSVAKYGDTARIGKSGQQRVEVTSSAVEVHDANGDLRLKTTDEGLELYGGTDSSNPVSTFKASGAYMGNGQEWGIYLTGTEYSSGLNLLQHDTGGGIHTGSVVLRREGKLGITSDGGDITLAVGGDHAVNISASNGLIINEHTTGIGSVLSATASKAITTAGIDTYTQGASIKIPIGTWVITGSWPFNTGSSSGARNLGVALSTSSGNANTGILARQRVYAYNNAYAQLQVVYVGEFEEETTVYVKGASSMTYTSATTTEIRAVRIA